MHGRHALESFLARLACPPPADCGVAMDILPFRGFLNLRGDANDASFAAAASTHLGQPLPVIANRFADGEHRVFWLAPDEWLVMTAPGAAAPLATRLAAALASQTHALTDVSSGHLCIRLRGANVRDALAKGCALDFHPQAFQPGHCAQTTLGKASMLIALCHATEPHADRDAFIIVVRRTFAEYAANWLHRSAQEYGVTLTELSE